MESEDLARLRIERPDEWSTQNRRSRRRRIGWATGLVAAAGLALFAFYLSGALTPAVEVESVKVSKMYVSDALTILNASGYVVAQREAAVSSKATGRLAEMHVEEGARVEEGDVLASLENRDLKAVLDETRAALKVARARLKNAEAELHDATSNFERVQALREAGAVSEQAFDSAEARYKKAVALERSASFGVLRAEASVKVAEVNLDYSFIRAPFDGVILTKNADVGEVVAPFGGAVNSKAAVVTMADMDSLMVEVDVSESSLEKVKEGGAAEIRLDALPNDRFAGTVHMIVPTADRSKATVMTKVRFNELDDRVLPEMSAKAAFLSRRLKDDEKAPVLAVPASALLEGAEPAVYRLSDSAARRVPVEVGRRWRDMVEVLSGLTEGDEVALEADTPGLEDGARIRRENG